MNSENVDTEPSLQMHKLPSVLFCGGGGGGVEGGQSFVGVGGGDGRVHIFLEGVGWEGYTLRKGQHSL